MGMGKTGIPWVPWDSHGNGNTISHGNRNGMGMGIRRMGLRSKRIGVSSLTFQGHVLSVAPTTLCRAVADVGGGHDARALFHQYAS